MRTAKNSQKLHRNYRSHIRADAERRRGHEVPHDGRDDGAAEDGPDARGHGHAALHRVPDVDQPAADDGERRGAEDAGEEAPDERGLDVLG